MRLVRSAGLELLRGDRLAGGIVTTIEPRAYDEAATVGRVADHVMIVS
jgi:hypothetical protein